MGMTMTQKILAAHAGLDSVQAGQLIEADLDLSLYTHLDVYKRQQKDLPKRENCRDIPGNRSSSLM